MKRIVALAASVLVAGCTVDKASAPALTGPSEFALSVTLSATPDQLPRDGSSQSVITVVVRDASARPVSGQRLSVATNIGSVSESAIVTGSDGRAVFAFTAPSSGTIGNAATIQVVPVSTDGANAAPRSVQINFTGVSNSGAPVPDFTVTPTNPERNLPVRFDASRTKDEGVDCLDSCTYVWNFGDGSSGFGRIVTHTFTGSGTFTVSLTATDAAGSSASTAKAVVVTAVAAPTVKLSVTPTTPLAGQAVTLLADVTTAPGHSVTKYEWIFGDGTSATTTSSSVVKTYQAQAAYVATVTVTDDLGQTGSASLLVDVATSGTTTIVYSPKDPAPGQRVQFTAITTTSGSSIKSYEWNFGDSEVSGGGTATGQSVEHTYNFGSGGALAHTYVVRLTVTDNNGVVTVITKDITVKVEDE